MAVITKKAPQQAVPEQKPLRVAVQKTTGGAGAKVELMTLGSMLILIASLLLLFGGYLLGASGLQASRDQDTAYDNFRDDLENAIAPVAQPITEGASIAILEIPGLKVRAVVAEGTSSEITMRGPGHLPSTVLPGQLGQSVIFGRRSTFGAPFAHLDALRKGDPITVTTGQGVSQYVVTDVWTSNSNGTINSAAAGQLLLVTSDPTLTPIRRLTASASLVGQPFPAGGTVAVRSDEFAGRGDTAALVPLVLWGQLLLVVVGAAVYGYQRWRRPVVYLLTTPIVAFVLWNVFDQVARLLPNTL